MQNHAEEPPGSITRFITCGASVDVDPTTARFVPHPAPDGTLWDMEIDIHPPTGLKAMATAEEAHGNLRMALDSPSMVARRMIEYWKHWHKGKGSVIDWIQDPQARELWPDIHDIGIKFMDHSKWHGRYRWHAHMAEEGIQLSGLSNIWPWWQ